MNFIKKLNNINIKDFKKIKFSQIVDQLKSKIDISINILLIVLTICMIIYVYNSYKKKSNDLTKEASILKEKLETVKKFEGLQKEYDDFIKNFPDVILINQAGVKISELADMYDIQVLSFSPSKNEKDEMKRTTRISIKISSSIYGNMLLFVKSLEELQYPLVIKSWSGGIKKSISRIGRNSIMDKNSIEVDIELMLIELTLKNKK